MHHAFPNMANNVAVPAVSTLVQLGVIYAGYNLFLCDLSTLMLIIGLLAALTFYDIIHYYCHFGYQTNIKWLNYLRTYHLKHHYRNEDRNFGVTSPIWDIVFGTYDCKKSV